MKYFFLAALATVAACAAPSQGILNQATANCSAGDRFACSQLPGLNAQVQSENQQNQVATGLAAGIGGAVAGGVIGAAVSEPGYYGRGYYNRGYYGPGYYGRRYW